MKFAKELEENAIPEWKDRYFDYKAAKKKLKTVGKAVRKVDPSSPLARKTPFGNATSVRDAPVYSFLNRGRDGQLVNGRDDNEQHPLRTQSDASNPQWRTKDDGESTPRAQPMTVANERSPLRTRDGDDAPPRMARYGSIIGSPPSGNSPMLDLTPQRTQASLLELPDPALAGKASQNETKLLELQADGVQDDQPVSPGSPDIPRHELQHAGTSRRQLSDFGNAHKAGQTTQSTLHRYGSFLQPKRTTSVPEISRPPFLQRMLSIAGPTASVGKPSPLQSRNNDIALEAYREVDFRQAEFFLFLDKQLLKIEDFYKTKEEESTERLNLLREQLHVLRNRRLEEIVEAEQKHKHSRPLVGNGALSFAQENLPFSNGANGERLDHSTNNDESAENGELKPEAHAGHGRRWASVTSQVDHALDKVRTGHVGKTSKAMEELGTPSNSRLDPDNRDYVRRQPKDTVPPYRIAKRKLKTALQEYYRGLELLKAYTLLNRTAFRKINKKYDKTVDVPSGGTMRYMSDKVNKAHFVTSDVIDSHLQAIEDLYARYFERGNRKIAIGKLRGKVLKLGDYTGSLWRTGLFLGSGIVLGVQGVAYGCLDLFDSDPTFVTNSSYLLQIYAGYFLFLLLVGLFCIDARIFSRAKVNYQFVFEFDSRHVLDWRQLSEIPAVFFFLLALTMFLNFTIRAGGSAMYIYWPVVLIGLSVILMLLPPPLFYWDSRRWFLYSLWRLLWSGFYPVEFRDFFLGDMFCSETYAMGNIELFFCLYARHWNDPPMCNSGHSRLLGFFSTLPGVWRALQCLKRYYDTRNKWPHLANCLKYGFTIGMYLTLSLFRLDKTDELKGLFIAVATINSIYCSLWDVFMDWSLGDFRAKRPFLRDTLAYKGHVWFYYVALVLDPILRFNWIFYAIFADDIQHSSIISFAVATSEVFRRGLWTIIRVENEHCTNVSRNRVVRDVELPYQRTSEETLSVAEFDGTPPEDDRPLRMTRDEESAADTAHSTGTQQRPQAATPSSAAFLRQRKQAMQAESPVAQALRRVGSTLAAAHSQDYERKRRPVEGVAEEQESDEEDEDDEADTEAAEALNNRAR